MRLQAFLTIIIEIITAIVGYEIHKSIFWTIIDLIFAPVAWAKWIICHEVTLAIIKQAFAWFL